MRAGRMRGNIVIQHQIPGAVDDYGTPVVEWAKFDEVRAAVEPVSGFEQMKYRQEQSISKVLFRIRYVAGVSTAMRVVSNGVIYNIAHVHDPEDRHRELVLTTEEKSYVTG